MTGQELWFTCTASFSGPQESPQPIIQHAESSVCVLCIVRGPGHVQDGVPCLLVSSSLISGCVAEGVTSGTPRETRRATSQVQHFEVANGFRSAVTRDVDGEDDAPDALSEADAETEDQVRRPPRRAAKSVACVRTRQVMLSENARPRARRDRRERRPPRARPTYKCEGCMKRFRTQKEAVRHLDIFHTEETPYACDICRMEFTLAIYLKRHMSSHGPRKSGTRHLKCDVCGVKFSHVSYLTVHQKTSGH
ncbi:zinc finger protein 865-like [Thrips palmi]|uniref:Zinc finger protein 865-like n=1 Tax=Thrips palmi TaxID=161013 RepID=A0A6P8YHX8_THRPL|nr:zinc finger protein 865-like [Thrips palmi]